VDGEGGVKEVTSVMRVEFGFWYGSVSESGSSAHDAADVAVPFDGPETDGLVRYGQGSHERCQQSNVRI
jgi:hypothetical protein